MCLLSVELLLHRGLLRHIYLILVAPIALMSKLAQCLRRFRPITRESAHGQVTKRALRAWFAKLLSLILRVLHISSGSLLL